ncbi:MAG: hypothetical protein AB8D52_01875 [Gammaproteobacteria bacterium]
MMRRLVLTTAVMLASQVVRADNSLTLPWDEFKTLYTEKIQQQFDQAKKVIKPESIASIDEAHYKVTVKGSEALVDVSIKGKQLQGKPKPIPLFDHNVAISQIREVQGGAIINDDMDENSGYFFYVDTTDENNSFQVNLTLVVTLTEERSLQQLTFNIPAAVRNILDVELPPGVELINHPGIQQSLQRYYFPHASEMNLSFADSNNRDQQLVDVDTFTQIELEGDKYIFTFHSVSDQFSKQNIELNYEVPLRYLDSTLSVSHAKSSDGSSTKVGELIVNMEQGGSKGFTIRFEADTKQNLEKIKLPTIKNNIGLENGFQIIEPIEAQISVSGKSLAQNISSSRLPIKLRQKNSITGTYNKAESFDLNLKRFETVESPQIVLDELFFYTSFADNGNEISVIRVELPENSSDRLLLNSIPGTEVWSLLVNGNKRDIFTQENDRQDPVWVIPLAEQGSSVIELTYSQKHKKLGLEGKLPITIPETGLAAQKVFVCVGLTSRLELVAVEGELTPDEYAQCPVVQSFSSGKPYIFQYPFYRGNALQAAIFYKEPLDNRSGDKHLAENGS